MLQSARAQPDTAAFTALLGQKKGQFNGKLALMVWRDSLVYQRAVGPDNTLSTQANVGTASAWFTAAVAMTFVDQGRISLDDKVSRYLPIFAQYAKKYLTIRQCLANTTGLAGEKGGIGGFFQKKKFQALEDEVNAFASAREIVSNPGEVFEYNDIGTDIVARVLEVVGKKSFDRLAQERIFRPCVMKRTTFSSDQAVNPFSGAESTPSDMMHFLQMLLKGGVFAGKRVLSENAVLEMQKIQTGSARMASVPKLVEGFGYGLGNWISGDGVITCPGFQSCWPVVNIRKHYACVIFGMPRDGEKKENFMDILSAVDEGM